MGGRLTARPRSVRRRDLLWAVSRHGLIPLLLVFGALWPSAASAQQDTVRVDTLAADTVPADTLTPRERALQRLRQLPRTPVQGDTAADTLAADTLAADTLPADTGAVIAIADTVPVDTAAAASALRALEAELGDGTISGDSLRQLLRTLETFQVTEYSGESAIFQADSNRLRLQGTSRVAREGSALDTDSVLVYDGETGVVCGYGNPVLTGQEGDPVESDRVCYDIERDLGEARGARTRFSQGGPTYYVRGAQNRVYMLTTDGVNSLYGERTEFTTCDLPEPHYTFQAGSVKMREDEVMVARDVTLKFQDVPVFWLPWMMQSMKRGRRSGLLMPEFGMNDIVRNSTGYERHLSNLGFYWAINDYMSARGTFEWFSGNWTAAEGALSYRWLRQFLQGGMTVKQYWRESGRRDLTLNTQNSWQPDERTRLNVSGNYATSTDFVRRNSFDPRELNRQITMNASANRSFDWGSMSLGYQRTQNLSDERVVQTLPSLSLSLQPMTLYGSEGGGFDVTWNGSGQFNRRVSDVQEGLVPGVRDSETRSANASHSLGFGRFSVSQSGSYTDQIDGPRPPLEPDSVGLPEERSETFDWSAAVSYQQSLWTGTTLTPRLSIGGRSVRNPETEGQYVAQPSRISTGAGLSTSIFGFWPGFGPFSRIRHKISPTLSWTYAPEVEASELQERIFGTSTLREQNRLSLSFNQTFEAKYADSDTAMIDTVAAGEAGDLRSLPQARKIMLLAINTSGSLEYDFVAAREESRGFRTEQITNSIKSDLLEGLQLTTTHDLFREKEPVEGEALPPRTFSPFLTRVSARFSIDDDFWLFRALGLSSEPAEDTVEVEEPAEGVGDADDTAVGAEADPDEIAGGMGSIVPGRGGRGDYGRRGVGGWQASLDYSLIRRRPEEPAGENNQMLRGNVSFQPTEHWSVRWSTGYSFTAGEFSDHVLTLTRDLHEWQANFDFIKAQNGNFALQFRVQLMDIPDLKLDYDQRTDARSRQ